MIARTVNNEGDDMKRSRGMELLGVLGFVAVWLALQLWVLPRMGVAT
jgi:hypothetical protein